MKPRRSLSGTISLVAATAFALPAAVAALKRRSKAHPDSSQLDRSGCIRKLIRALWVCNDDQFRPPTGNTAEMYEAYFTKRLLEALRLAERAEDAEERSIHLRASRYYRDLLEYPEKRRAVRFPARIRAMLHGLGVRPRRVIVTDLSFRGFRMQLDEEVKPGHLVTLEMDGLSPVNAFVVWQEEEQVGCKFLSELHPALVEAALAVGSRS